MSRRRVTVLHNPTAGEGSDPDSVRRPLAEAGLAVSLVSTDDPGWRAALGAPADAVVAAGGDGTVRRAAEALAGGEVPLAVLPRGTANNVAAALGIGGRVEDLLAALGRARPQRLDVGVATGPWGRRVFVESAGAGALADSARDASEAEGAPSGEDEIAFARALLRGGLLRARPRPELRLDPEEEAPLFLEVCLLPLGGPRLRLAPDADPEDGLFDVVRGGARERDALLAALAGAAPGEVVVPRLDAPPERRARVTLALRPRDLRVDGTFGDALAPDGGDAPTEIALEVRPRALPLLLPPPRG